jgi:hypothetical protein
LINPLLGSADGGAVNGWGRPYPYGGLFDIANGEWKPLPTPPRGARAQPGAPEAAFGAVGASSALYFSAGGWLFDATTDSWSQVERLPGAHEQATPPLVAAGRDALAFIGNALWRYQA